MEITTAELKLTSSDWVEIHMALQERIHQLKETVKTSPTPDYWRPKLVNAERTLANFEQARFSAL